MDHSLDQTCAFATEKVWLRRAIYSGLLDALTVGNPDIVIDTGGKSHHIKANSVGSEKTEAHRGGRIRRGRRRKKADQPPPPDDQVFSSPSAVKWLLSS